MSEFDININEKEEEGGVDLEALKAIEEIQRLKSEGSTIHRSIQTDAYFRPSNMESLQKYEEYIKGQPDKISLLAVDLSQAELFKSALAVINRNSNVFGVAGYAPNVVGTGIEANISELENIIRYNKKILAIGKIGLDFHFAPYTNQKQVKLLRDQLDLAVKYGKPVFLTSKKADSELLKTVREYNKKHATFRGVCVPVIRSLPLFELANEKGMYLLIRPEITYEEESLYKQCVKEFNPEKLLVASGGDLYAPEPHRGTWNCPQFIEQVINYSAELFKMYPSEFTTQMAINFNTIFNTPPEAGDDVFYMTVSATNKKLIMTEAELLENDIDEDGDELIIIEVDDKTKYGAPIYWDKDNGRLIYTPKENFSGTDTFKYTITDARGGVDSANVTIHVRLKG